jgi:hypothetical protein
MTRKKISLICSAVAASTTMCGGAIAVSIYNKNKISTGDNDSDMPANYEKCSLNKKITNDTLKKFKTYKVVDGKYLTVINKDDFAKNINDIYRKLFANDDRFKAKANSYIVNVNHLFKNNAAEVEVEVI